MYNVHFGLARPPYKITPDTRLFYPGGERGAILETLRYAILNGDAIIKVVGEVGSGKTMLCRMLETRLPESVEIVYLANPSLSPDNILHAIAFELGLAADSALPRFEVMKQLQDFLLRKHAGGRQVAVFVEEAQSMPLETLEEIRLLSNLETQQHKLLQMVLFGQPELDQALAAPHVRQIKDRITNSFELPPLKTRDVHGYLMFRLREAGYRGPDLFSRRAVRAIARISGGLMRRINILADKALLAAYIDKVRMVTPRHVRAATRECEFVSRRSRFRFSWVALFLLMAAGAGAGVLTGFRYGHPGPPAAEPPPSMEAPPVAAVSERPTTLLQQRLEATREWLADVDPRHFSIQLLLADVGEKEALERFLQQRAGEGELEGLFVYSTTVQGRAKLGVLYGNFSGYTEADRALKGLPEALHRYRPYLRNLSQIRAESAGAGGSGDRT